MGTSKAWLTFGDETLLQRVVGLVREVTPLIIVVAAVGQLLPVLPKDAVVVRDTSQGRGPLEGLAVGLAATAPHARLAFVTTADAPFFSASFALRLATLCHDDAALPNVGGRVHPLTAAYRTSLWTRARSLIETGERRALALAEQSLTRYVFADELLAEPRVAADDPALSSLVNLNTPADYKAALSKLTLGVRPL